MRIFIGYMAKDISSLALLCISVLIFTQLSAISINNQLPPWLFYENVKIKTWMFVCQGHIK